MRLLTKNQAFAALYNEISIPLALAHLLPLWLAGLGITQNLLFIFLSLAVHSLANCFFTRSQVPTDLLALA